MTFAMEPQALPDIDKLAWLQVVDRRVLAARTRGRPRAYLPGGKREAGESDAAALVREVREELGVELDPASIRFAARFRAPADGQPQGVHVSLTCYRATAIGKPAPCAEIEELVWLTQADRPHCSAAGRLALDWLAQRGEID